MSDSPAGSSPSPPSPVIAAVEMGYGHLRAAQALADRLGTRVLHVDRPPVAEEEEQRLWQASRRFYEITSRTSQLPVVGAPMRSLLDSLTAIPHLYPYRDLSAPTLQVRSLDRLIRKGLGRGLAGLLCDSGAPLLSTFFTSAISAGHHGCERVYCVVTDVDINRAWVPLEPERSRIVYLAPSHRAVRRLRSYGVAPDRIEMTGFPLPHELLGGMDVPVARHNLAARLVRLDPARAFRSQARDELHTFLGVDLPAREEGRPPLATFTVGGAGAQAGLARSLLWSLRPLLGEGQLRLCLSAGVRQEVADRFTVWIREAGLEGHPAVSVLCEKDFESYYTAFNELLAGTDILWTKPSEMTFYAALGLPLVLSPPVGVHEGYNRRWAIENGAGLKQRHPDYAGFWIREWLSEGTLAAAAWSGFLRLPKFGVYHILERVCQETGTRAPSTPSSAISTSSTSVKRFHSAAPSGESTRR